MSDSNELRMAPNSQRTSSSAILALRKCRGQQLAPRASLIAGTKGLYRSPVSKRGLPGGGITREIRVFILNHG